MPASLKKLVRAALPYAADAGAAAYAATAAFAVVVAVAEFLRPGVAVTAVAPQGLLGVMLVTGGIALLDEPDAKRGVRARLAAAVAGAAAAMFAFWAAWYYFSPVPGAVPRIPVAVAAIVAALIASACAEPTEP